MSVGAIMAGAAFVKLTLDDAALQKGLENAKDKIKAIRDSFNVAATEMATAFAAINVPIVGAMRSFSAFDDQMRMIQAVTGATGAAFDSMTEKAKQLGRETSFMAKEVAAGMLALGRMGLNPQQIESAIKPMMNLARVTGTDLAQAAEIAANQMRVFSMTAEDMANISDILSVTANSSAQTLGDLGEALKMAAPHAKRAGADLKDTAAALGILANMGIRGSLAGTALGKSYKRLADPKVIDFLKSYGIETLNTDGSMRRMRDTLVDMARVMQTMTNAQQINFAEKVFDARGSLGGGTLAVNTDAIDELVKKLDESEGAAQRAADVMENGIGGAMRRLSSAAEGVSLAFGEIISISFLPLVEKASALCAVFRELLKENSLVIGGFAKLLYLGLGLGAVAKAVSLINSAFVKIVGPLVSAVASLDRYIVSLAKAAKAEKVLTAAEKASMLERQVGGALLGSLTTKELFLTAIKKDQTRTILTASLTEMVAAKISAGASTIRAIGYTYEAIAAKLAAGAVALLNLALTALVAHPVTAVLAAAVAVLSIMAIKANGAAKEMRALAEASEKASNEAHEKLEAGDQRRQDAKVGFERLKQLEEVSKKGKLTAEEMQEAEKIMSSLAAYGSAYWASLDKLSGKLELTADAQDKFNGKMQDAARLQIQAEISALEAEKKALDAETKGLQGYWHNNGFAAVFGIQANALRQIEANADKATAVFQKILAAKARLKALDAGDEKAVTGEEGKTTQDRIDETAEQMAVETEKLEEAEKKIKNLEEDLAKQRRTNLENELEGIRKVREEYEKNIAVMLEQKRAEMSIAKARGETDRAATLENEIRALEEQKKAAMASYDKQAADARKKDEETKRKEEARKQRERKSFDDYLDKMSRDAANEELDKKLDQMAKAKGEGENADLQNYLNVLIESASKALNAAVSEYNDKLATFSGADSEGGVELADSEKDALRDIQQTISASKSRLDSYVDRLDRAREAASDAVAEQRTSAVGSWSLEAIGQLFDASAEDRTASATETMVSQQEKQIALQEKSNRTLEKIKDKSTLQYGD